MQTQRDVAWSELTAGEQARFADEHAAPGQGPDQAWAALPAVQQWRYYAASLDARIAQAPDGVELTCAFTARTTQRACRAVVMVTGMAPNDGLYHELVRAKAKLSAAGIRRVVRIGDCYGPGTIATAVWQGHRFARDLGAPIPDKAPFKRENVKLAAL